MQRKPGHSPTTRTSRLQYGRRPSLWIEPIGDWGDGLPSSWWRSRPPTRPTTTSSRSGGRMTGAAAQGRGIQSRPTGCTGAGTAPVPSKLARVAGTRVRRRHRDAAPASSCWTSPATRSRALPAGQPSCGAETGSSKRRQVRATWSACSRTARHRRLARSASRCCRAARRLVGDALHPDRARQGRCPRHGSIGGRHERASRLPRSGHCPTRRRWRCRCRTLRHRALAWRPALQQATRQRPARDRCATAAPSSSAARSRMTAAYAANRMYYVLNGNGPSVLGIDRARRCSRDAVRLDRARLHQRRSADCRPRCCAQARLAAGHRARWPAAGAGHCAPRCLCRPTTRTRRASWPGLQAMLGVARRHRTCLARSMCSSSATPPMPTCGSLKRRPSWRCSASAPAWHDRIFYRRRAEEHRAKSRQRCRMGPPLRRRLPADADAGRRQRDGGSDASSAWRPRWSGNPDVALILQTLPAIVNGSHAVRSDAAVRRVACTAR